MDLVILSGSDDVLILGGIQGPPGIGKDAQFVVLAVSPELTNERVLTGTANQIKLTDAGAGAALTLSLEGPYTPATYTAHAVLLGQGTSSITAVAVPSVTGKYLRSVANADPVFSTLTLPDVATQGDLLFASGANVIGNLADVAVGSYLRSGGVGVNPLWSTMKLPDAATQGDLFAASAADTMSAIAAVEAGRVLRSTGAGALPAYTAAPVLGLAGTTQGSLGLSGATAGVLTLAAPANVTGSYSLTFPAAAPAQGGIVYFGDAAGQLAATGALTAKSLMLSQGTGAPTALGAATNGQIPIGSTGNNPVLAALTQGTGITITNAPGSITLDVIQLPAATSPPPNVVDQTAVQGVVTRYAREDHTHGLGPITNNIALRWKDSGGTSRDLLNLTSADLIQLGHASVDNLRVLSDSMLFQAGAAGNLGTFDNFGLNFKTNNTSFLTVTAAGAATFASTLAVTGHVTFEGVTSTGAIGTGKLVFNTNPQIDSLGIGRAADGTAGNLAVNNAVDVYGAAITLRGAANSAFAWNGYGHIYAPSDGVFTWTNDATTGFGRLQLGGTTSSFPALKRSGTSVAVRLADDSADGSITAAAGTFSTTLSVTGHVTFEGVTSTGATGTGKLVFDTLPQVSGLGVGRAAAANNIELQGVLNTYAAGNQIILRGGANSAIAINGLGVMKWPSDGVFTFTNDAGTGFGRLQFGGTTTSFPALKRSSATLAVRLADDSADAGLSASTLALSGDLTLADAVNIAVNTTTGTKIGTSTSQKLGFWNAMPVVRDATAYTQTFATASHTHAARTSSAVSTTVATNITPWGYQSAAQADAITNNLNAVRADLDNTAQVLNALIDALQSYGFAA